MIAINNAGLANIGLPPVNETGFSPVVTAAITWGTSIVFTDGSSFPSTDTFKNINLTIVDEDGKTVVGAITTAEGTATLSIAALKPTGVYQIAATVTSTKGCIADGGLDVTSADTTGTVASYSVSFTTAI